MRNGLVKLYAKGSSKINTANRVKITSIEKLKLVKDKNAILLFVSAKDALGKEYGTKILVMHSDIDKFIKLYERFLNISNAYNVYDKTMSFGLLSMSKSFIPLQTNPYYEHGIYINGEGGPINPDVLKEFYHDALNM